MTRRPSFVRARTLSLSVVAFLCVPAVGCDAGSRGGSAPDRDVSPATAEIVVPAGEGSGEPNLSSAGDRVFLSWLEPSGEEWALRVASVGPGSAEIGPVRTVVERSDFFVNWADFPSVTLLADGRLAAHWLQRGGEGTYDYGIRVAWSEDEGATWSEPWTPHDDGTPTEHGFVSTLPGDDGSLGLVWLDGRAYSRGPDGPETDEMSLRYRAADGPGEASAEVLLDGRVCDCCQTGAARTGDGWVVAYRDRSDDEIRDIYVTRLTSEGWTPGRPVHRDGWHIAACPVNGPAVAADGDRVVVAWFTGAAERPRVSVAFSDDQGATFSEPVRIDDGDPVGRVDVLLDGEAAQVSWMETVGEGAELRVQRVDATGAAGTPWTVARLTAARAAGFPRMVRQGRDLVFAWTEVDGESTRVRAVRASGVLTEDGA